MLPEALMMMIWFIDNCLFILVWNLKCFIVGIAISSAFIMVLKLVLSFQLLFLPQVILVFFFFYTLFVLVHLLVYWKQLFQVYFYLFKVGIMAGWSIPGLFGCCGHDWLGMHVSKMELKFYVGNNKTVLHNSKATKLLCEISFMQAKYG